MYFVEAGSHRRILPRLRSSDALTHNATVMRYHRSLQSSELNKGDFNHRQKNPPDRHPLGMDNAGCRLQVAGCRLQELIWAAPETGWVLKHHSEGIIHLTELIILLSFYMGYHEVVYIINKQNIWSYGHSKQYFAIHSGIHKTLPHKMSLKFLKKSMIIPQ